MRSHGAKTDAMPFWSVAKPVFFSAALGLAITAIVLVLFSLGLSLWDVPQGLIVPLSLVAMAIGVFAGGFLAAVKLRKKGLLTGCLTGALFYLVLTVVSLALNGLQLDSSQFVKLALALLAGSVGGAVGMNRLGKRKA